MKVVLAVMISFPMITGFSWFSAEEKASQDQSSASNPEQVSRINRTTADLGLQSEVENLNAPVVRGTTIQTAGESAIISSKSSSSSLRELQQLNRTLKTVETASEAETIKAEMVPSPLTAPLAETASREGIEISRLQKQINEILQVNERLKVQHEEQLVQIRKITEQAAMHRRMLNDLERKDSRLEQVSTADMDEVLRQEKIRLIQQETEKNKNYVSQLTTRQSPNVRVS